MYLIRFEWLLKNKPTVWLSNNKTKKLCQGKYLSLSQRQRGIKLFVSYGGKFLTSFEWATFDLYFSG